jgi:prepilin-type N-terminal cleavage/methylation domain-containing protein
VALVFLQVTTMKHREKGVTLAEVIIALGLISILAGVGLASIYRSLPNYRLTWSVRALVVQIHRTRLRAVHQGTSCYLDFDFDNDGDLNGDCVFWEDRNNNRKKDHLERGYPVWTLNTFGGVQFQAYPAELGGPEQGPNNTMIDAGGGDGVAFSWGQNRIKFNSNGTSYAGTIYLHSSGGLTYAIRLRSNGLTQLWRHAGDRWRRW